MPAKGFQKPEPLDCRIKVQLTNGQQQKLAKLADEARVSQSEYMRSLLDSVDGPIPVAKPLPPKRPPPFAQQQLMEIHELAMQVRKVGVSINQLARQANTGMVAIRRSEVEAMLAMHEELMLKAIAHVEKALT
jgi:hypothetical protein